MNLAAKKSKANTAASNAAAPFSNKIRPMSKNQFVCKTGRKSGARRRNQHQKVKQLTGVERFRQLLKLKNMRVRNGAPSASSTSTYPVWHGIGAQYNKLHSTKVGSKLTWRGITDHEKFLYCCQVTAEQGGYSFTVKLNPHLVDQWVNGRNKVFDRVRKRIAKVFRERKLRDLLIAYVIEGKTKRGCNTSLHLHGVFAGVGHVRIGSVKAALEKALDVGPYRGGKGSHLDVHIAAYGNNVFAKNSETPGTWGIYCTKHIMKPDPRLPDKRIYINQTMSKELQRFWSVLMDSKP